MKSRAEILLNFYSQFHGRQPTVMEALRRQPTISSLMYILLLALTGAYQYLVGDNFTFYLMGFVVAGLAHRVADMLRFKRDWPTLDRVLDWPAVERELMAARSQKNQAAS
jgi:hypothetical protein